MCIVHRFTAVIFTVIFLVANWGDKPYVRYATVIYFFLWMLGSGIDSIIEQLRSASHD